MVIGIMLIFLTISKAVRAEAIVGTVDVCEAEVVDGIAIDTKLCRQVLEMNKDGFCDHVQGIVRLLIRKKCWNVLNLNYVFSLLP